MKILYSIIFLLGFHFFAAAQVEKNIPPAETTQVKVLKFYPNPATAVINFEFQKQVEKNFTLQIYNFVGKKIFTQPNITQKTTIPLQEFFRGVYIFQLRDKLGRIVESGKFQVNK